MTTKRSSKLALLGYSAETMAAARTLGYDFVAVVPPGFETALHAEGVEAIPWQFDKRNEESNQLRTELTELGCRMAVPLYEECVEWAGAINSVLLDDPRRFAKAMLLRDKAMMKRKAQMSGIRVGAFEEVESQQQLGRFFARINEAHARIEGDALDPIHVKPLRAAGSVGHRIIREPKQMNDIPHDAYPLLAESHLGGKEFSCEAFVHGGRVVFLNINEYVHLGYTQFSPPSAQLEAVRPQIRREVERLVKAFDIQYGLIHPEFFLGEDGELAFGEVANRVPGGHIFELIERAYGFDPYQALLLTSDDQVSDAEIDAFFPHEVTGQQGFAGNCLVFPKQQFINELKVPQELLDHPLYERHTLYQPIAHKVVERVGFGNHYGTLFFFGSDAEAMREALQHFEQVDFYA